MHRSYDTDRFDASPPDEHHRLMGQGWDGRKLPKRPHGQPANPASHRTPGNVRNSSIDCGRAHSLSPLPNGTGPDRTAPLSLFGLLATGPAAPASGRPPVEQLKRRRDDGASSRPAGRDGGTACRMTTSERIAGAVLCVWWLSSVEERRRRPAGRSDRTGQEHWRKPSWTRTMEMEGGGIERCWWLLLPLCASSDPNSNLLSCRVLSFQLSTTRTPQRDAQHWRRLRCARVGCRRH